MIKRRGISNKQKGGSDKNRSPFFHAIPYLFPLTFLAFCDIIMLYDYV